MGWEVDRKPHSVSRIPAIRKVRVRYIVLICRFSGPGVPKKIRGNPGKNEQSLRNLLLFGEIFANEIINKHINVQQKMLRLMTTIAAAAVGTAALAQNFTLKSNELSGWMNPRQYANERGFDGQNQSPELSWDHVPAGTKTFAVTIYDMDAPTGHGFWHWVIFNIPTDVRELPTGAGTPEGYLAPSEAVQSLNDTGKPGYFGMAPPPGPPHRYVITVYAVDKKLNLGPGAKPHEVTSQLETSTLATASLLEYGEK